MNIESTGRAHERLLSEAAVKDRTTLSRVQRWRMTKNGTFPAPVKISAGRCAWPESAIDDWIASKLAAG